MCIDLGYLLDAERRARVETDGGTAEGADPAAVTETAEALPLGGVGD